MKKEAMNLIKSLERFENKLREETNKVQEAIDVVETAMVSFTQAGKAHKELKKKLTELEKKTEKLVSYKGFDITKNYEEHTHYNAMKFIDKMHTTLNLVKGINKKSEKLDIKIVPKKYIEELLKKNKEYIEFESSELIMKNNLEETLVVTLGDASEHEYYLSGITYNSLPKARVQFSTLYKFLDFFSDEEHSKSRVLQIFMKR
ncbi:MAG: hypothetical protein M0R46_16065 [Candidatus Muirbacterium halophilum]|nr:hypothetical protein [Candidatus Muirbacterium halophilum]MCK9477432.1 hypothetical protein [Candidatus Muirbacterium halophilum]